LLFIANEVVTYNVYGRSLTTKVDTGKAWTKGTGKEVMRGGYFTLIYLRMAQLFGVPCPRHAVGQGT